MIALIDPKELNILTITLPPMGESSTIGATGSQSNASCLVCDAFRPVPQLSGNLQVDPEIHLPSFGLDLDFAYYYNSLTVVGTPLINAPFGYMRTLAPFSVAQLYNSGDSLTIERGDGALVSYQFRQQPCRCLSQKRIDPVHHIVGRLLKTGVKTVPKVGKCVTIHGVSFSLDK